MTLRATIYGMLQPSTLCYSHLRHATAIHIVLLPLIACYCQPHWPAAMLLLPPTVWRRVSCPWDYTPHRGSACSQHTTPWQRVLTAHHTVTAHAHSTPHQAHSTPKKGFVSALLISAHAAVSSVLPGHDQGLFRLLLHTGRQAGRQAGRQVDMSHESKSA